MTFLYTTRILGSKWWVRYHWWTVASDFMWVRDLLRMNIRVIWVQVLQETLGGWLYSVRWNYSVYAKSGIGYCGVWTRCLGSDITAWCDIGLGVDIIYIYCVFLGTRHYRRLWVKQMNDTLLWVEQMMDTLFWVDCWRWLCVRKAFVGECTRYLGSGVTGDSGLKDVYRFIKL